MSASTFDSKLLKKNQKQLKELKQKVFFNDYFYMFDTQCHVFCEFYGIHGPSDIHRHFLLYINGPYLEKNSTTTTSPLNQFCKRI